MALLHWRKFAFFDEEYIVDTELNQLVSQEKPKDSIDDGNPFITVSLSCSSSGKNAILLGDTNGYAYIIDKHLKVNSFRANQKFTSHLKQVPKLPLFITAGSDQDGINPMIKIWNPEKTDRLNQPTCIRLIRANSGFTKPSAITCIECNDTLTLMAVGYEDGTIVLFHGDITKQRRSRFSRPIKVSEHPITAIVIIGEARVNEPASSASYLTGQSSRVETTAFITTRDEVFYANLSDKAFSKNQLDQMGCKPKCCSLVPSSDSKNSIENLFAVGRQNAVFFYQTDGRGPCLAFDGDKLVLYRFKTYLVMISRDVPGKIDANAMLRSRRQPGGEMGTINESKANKRVTLNIYDINNKYIAHSTIVPEIKELVSEWGQLYAVCENGQVLVFREKDTQTKLDALFKKNQFSLLIDIAKSHQYNEDALTDIFKQYGDHLYKKGDFDGAVQQYIKIIGRSEPSYVIKKFLESKRISFLTIYLEALHKNYAASPDHTKLLLNCYSKLRNDQQLKSFIESYEGGNLQFDVDIAIKVLRDAGFYEFALYLAKKHQRHEFYFKVQIEDENNIIAALDYMNEMTDSNEMAHYMKKYGRSMLKDEPEKTIIMIKEICKRSFQLSRDRVSGNRQFNLLNIPRRIYPDEFFHIFVHSNEIFIQLLEQLVDDDVEFVTKAVYNILLELYLKFWRREKDDIMRNLHADKIKKLLAEPNGKFDLDQALILCRNNRFDEGLMELYAQAKLYHLILQYHIDQDDSLQIMKTCERYGRENPNLYMPALIHYSKTGDERLAQLLKAIEHHKVIPPMVVIKIILESKHATLGSVKEYLIRYLSRLSDRRLDNENAIDHYKDDTEVVRHKIEEFENHQTVFKPSKCSACQDILDLPSVHFLCSHSYHQSCFHNYSAESDECPICVTNNRKLLDEIGSHETSKSTFQKLEKEFTDPSDDVFNSLAKLFGYGLFNQTN